MDINDELKHSKNYVCPKCDYVSKKTFLVVFEGDEYRFCNRCYLEFLKATNQLVIEIPDEVRENS